jgi:hypothetical protein
MPENRLPEWEDRFLEFILGPLYPYVYTHWGMHILLFIEAALITTVMALGLVLFNSENSFWSVFSIVMLGVYTGKGFRYQDLEVAELIEENEDQDDR